MLDVVYKEGVGWTTCNIVRAALDGLGLIFGTAGIIAGIRSWRATGSLIRWAENPLATNNSASLYTKNLGRLYGSSAKQIRQIIPRDWKVQYSPFGKNNIEQWKFTSPNGLEEVRIHQPMNNPNGPWQVRWGIKDVGQIPSQYKPLEAPPNPFDNNYWLYFDRYGVPKHYQSPDVHELFTVKVTLADMIKVFGKP